LPIEESVTTWAVAATKGDVQASMHAILESIGRLTDEFASESPKDSTSAIVGSGHMHLNPTIFSLIGFRSDNRRDSQSASTT